MELKKAVDANLEILDTVLKGHLFASACRSFGVTKLDSKLPLLPGIYQASAQQKLEYVCSLAAQAVDECSLIDTSREVTEMDDKVYSIT